MDIAEYPAIGREEIFENIQTLLKSPRSDRISDHTVVAYCNDWKAVVSTTGVRRACAIGKEITWRECPRV